MEGSIPVSSKEQMVKYTREQIYEAFIEGQMDVIDSLLESGFDVNASIMGIPPLHWVCSGTEPWNVDIVTKLLIHGADVDLECKSGTDALGYCFSAVPFQPHIAQLLLDCSKKGINCLNSYGYNYLWNTNNVEAIKFLVENGIDVNHVVYNTTYLNFSRRVDDINYLLSVGAKLYLEL